MRVCVALVLLAAIVGGCGATSTTSTSGTKKPAKQILEEAAVAFGRAHSVAIDGNVAIKKRPATIALELERPGNLSLKINQGGQAASVIVAGGNAYIKANTAFYEALDQHIPQAAVTLLANRWFKSSEGVGELTKGLNLGTLGRCMTRELGTLEVSGMSTVNGQPAVAITSAGDRPGATPAKFYVAARGEPFLLRAVATGRQRSGGARNGECNEATEATEAGEELTFSRYNSHMNIAAPAAALEAGQFAHNQQT